MNRREGVRKEDLESNLLLEYEMKEKTIACNQCGTRFIFTVSQQERVVALGFDEPKRCRDCREKESKGSLSRREEKMRHNKGELRRQREFMYNIRKKRDALIVANK
jgi:alpha-tubulin suppressor-like RCC1 family protein